MTLKNEDVRNIAQLARLQISDSAIEQLTSDLSNILALAEQMKAVDTTKVIPMAHPMDATQRLRDDEVESAHNGCLRNDVFRSFGVGCMLGDICLGSKVQDVLFYLSACPVVEVDCLLNVRRHPDCRLYRKFGLRANILNRANACPSFRCAV